MSGCPRELVDGWETSTPSLPADAAVGFHYHDVEEWLSVVSGEITFFTLDDRPFPVGVGDALWIPRGEVHRVVAGPAGAEYRMHVPLRDPDFSRPLTSAEVTALREHLAFPDHEDGRTGDGRAFFERVLADGLVFCNRDGDVLGKASFTSPDRAFVDRGRASAGSVRVLNRTARGMLISTVVTVTDAGGVHATTNVRFLAAEGDALRCAIWVNHPEPGLDRAG